MTNNVSLIPIWSSAVPAKRSFVTRRGLDVPSKNRLIASSKRNLTPMSLPYTFLWLGVLSQV
jgi:hypothetical protein